MNVMDYGKNWVYLSSLFSLKNVEKRNHLIASTNV